MSHDSNMENTQSSPNKLLQLLSRERKQTGYGLLAVAALFWVATVWLAAKYRLEYVVIAAGFGWLAVVFSWAGAFQVRREPGRADEMEVSRALVLAVAGLSGLVVTLMGLVLAWQWWDAYLAWLRSEPGQEGWRMWLSLIAFFGGLAIMFVGLQLGRTEERSRPFFRRLLYGYNTVLTTLLLMAILIVINVLVYVNFATAIDFTASNLYSLSSRSKAILKEGLEKPTKIYVLMVVGSTLQQEMQTLLTNCREVNDKIEVKYLSPDLDEDQVRELERKYSFTGREGVLVVYGDPKEENHRFIPVDDLFSVDSFGSRELKFKGEDALMTALSALSEGKSKPVVYFTQGHGEFDLNNSDTSRLDEGTGALRSRLEKRNYDVRPLELGPANPKIPDDASIVVIARPSIPFAPAAIDALRRYMKPPDAAKKKGKLFVLFDVVLSPENTMVRTGLEDFMKEFNVEVGDQRDPRLPIGFGQSCTNPGGVQSGADCGEPACRDLWNQGDSALQRPPGEAAQHSARQSAGFGAARGITLTCPRQPWNLG